MLRNEASLVAVFTGNLVVGIMHVSRVMFATPVVELYQSGKISHSRSYRKFSATVRKLIGVPVDSKLALKSKTLEKGVNELLLKIRRRPPMEVD